MIGQKITTQNGVIYIIESEIGHGGFGTVYLAHNENKEAFAIKMIGPVKDSEDLESFNREVSMSEVQHPNVLGFIEHGKHVYGGKDYFFTVAEFCPDGNYRKILDREIVPVDSVVDEFRQILLGLEALHQHVIHRDLKPENIMVSGSVLKIGDLGLSKSIDEATKTLTFKGSGTPRYMAPEVWERKKITGATDLYAVGIMLFEALTGSVPFDDDDFIKLREKHLFEQAPRVKSLNKDIPDKIDGLVKKLLEKDSIKRYQTAKEVLDVLSAETSVSAESLSVIRARIRQNYDIEQGKQLEEQKRRDDAVTARKKIQYMEQQLIDQFDEVIEEINKDLQETKIQRRAAGSDIIYSLGNRSLSVGFFTQDALYENRSPSIQKTLKEHGVVHGGGILIKEGGESRQGWNTVLTQRPEDLYGEWLLVESDLGFSEKSLRYPPALTSAELLSENLSYHWQVVMHTWQLKTKKLQRSDAEKIVGIFIP